MSSTRSSHGTRPGIRVDHRVLHDVRRTLLREEQRLGSGWVEPPGTGATTGLTATTLAMVAAAVAVVAEELTDTAATLGRLLDDLDAHDDRVGSAFARLRAAVGP